MSVCGTFETLEFLNDGFCFVFLNVMSTDIAVGAPYDDLGKVFIYHGSPSGINTKPTQVSRSLAMIFSAFCLVAYYIGLSTFSHVFQFQVYNSMDF